MGHSYSAMSANKLLKTLELLTDLKSKQLNTSSKINSNYVHFFSHSQLFVIFAFKVSTVRFQKISLLVFTMFHGVFPNYFKVIIFSLKII